MQRIFFLFAVLRVLSTDAIESLVIAYKKAEGGDDILNSLQSLWSVIEEYKEAGKILSVGLSDVDTEVFIQFFKAANVKNFHYLNFKEKY